MCFLTWDVSLSAIDWDTHALCLVAVLSSAFGIYQSGAWGMFLWPQLMTVVILWFFGGCFLFVCFLRCTPSLRER